jgi:hypothetical protein
MIVVLWFLFPITTILATISLWKGKRKLGIVFWIIAVIIGGVIIYNCVVNDFGADRFYHSHDDIEELENSLHNIEGRQDYIIIDGQRYNLEKEVN